MERVRVVAGAGGSRRPGGAAGSCGRRRAGPGQLAGARRVPLRSPSKVGAANAAPRWRRERAARLDLAGDEGSGAPRALGSGSGFGLQRGGRVAQRTGGLRSLPERLSRWLCRAEGEGAAGGSAGGESSGGSSGGFSLPWQRKKGGEGGSGGGAEVNDEEAMNKPNIFIRLISACMYFIPWIDAQQLSNYFYDQWSVLLPFYMVPAWPAKLYFFTPMAPLIWFFMLFSLVIRNKRLPHFLRFHTMQAMMTDIVVMLVGLTRQSLPYYVAGSWVDAVLSQYAFLCALLTVLWCIWKTVEGYYVELPFVSEAVYIQLSIADMM